MIDKPDYYDGSDWPPTATTPSTDQPPADTDSGGNWWDPITRGIRSINSPPPQKPTLDMDKWGPEIDKAGLDPVYKKQLGLISTYLNSMPRQPEMTMGQKLFGVLASAGSAAALRGAGASVEGAQAYPLNMINYWQNREQNYYNTGVEGWKQGGNLMLPILQQAMQYQNVRQAQQAIAKNKMDTANPQGGGSQPIYQTPQQPLPPAQSAGPSVTPGGSVSQGSPGIVVDNGTSPPLGTPSEASPTMPNTQAEEAGFSETPQHPMYGNPNSPYKFHYQDSADKAGARYQQALNDQALGLTPGMQAKDANGNLTRTVEAPEKAIDEVVKEDQRRFEASEPFKANVKAGETNAEEMAKYNAKEFQNLQDLAAKTPEVEQRIALQEHLLDVIKNNDFGLGAGADWRLKIAKLKQLGLNAMPDGMKNFFGTFGIHDDNNLIAALEGFEKLSTTDIMGVGPAAGINRITQGELLHLFPKVVTGIGTSDQGNRILLNIHKAQLAATKEIASAAADYTDKHGHFDAAKFYRSPEFRQAYERSGYKDAIDQARTAQSQWEKAQNAQSQKQSENATAGAAPDRGDAKTLARQILAANPGMKVEDAMAQAFKARSQQPAQPAPAPASPAPEQQPPSLSPAATGGANTPKQSEGRRDRDATYNLSPRPGDPIDNLVKWATRRRKDPNWGAGIPPISIGE